MKLSSTDKGILLLAARESIQSLYYDVSKTIIDFRDYPNLLVKTGAFVTLTLGGYLRGCIGYLVSENNLYETVGDAAKQAAAADPRFAPLTAEEVEHINIEISVLTPPVKLDSYEEIVIGTHGLILDEPGNRGVLLPQVAVEHNFTVPQFLSALCEKAGLHSLAWQQKMLNISSFSAIVFSEEGKRVRTYGG